VEELLDLCLKAHRFVCHGCRFLLLELERGDAGARRAMPADP
jgi:LSD1 subclass zinc finger protein